MNVIDFNGRKYVMDLDKVLEFIYGNPEKKHNYETVITQSYGYPTTMSPDEVGNSEMQLISKETTENKSSMNEVMTNIRYDLVKYLLGMIDVNPEESWKFGFAFDTLCRERIIIEITDKNGK